MRVNLVPENFLSEVTFVHDYLQLGFQETRFSFYNKVRFVSGPVSATQGEPEFSGRIVGLIGQYVLSASSGANVSLELTFSGGAKVQVLRGKRFQNGPEAYQFHTRGGPIVVEQNE